MLYYLSHGRFPSRKAHTIQMIQMCEAFAKNGQETTLVHPSYRNGSISFEDIESFYGVEEEFAIRTLRSFKGKNSIPNMPTSGEMSLTAWLITQTLRGNISSDDIIYSRYKVPTFLFVHFLDVVPGSRRPTVIHEQHQFDSDHPFATARFYDRLDGIVCIADLLREYLIETHGIPPRKVFVAHDGVDSSRYEGITTRSARERLGLPLDEKVVMYTGHLYPEKQVETLVKAASDIDATVYVVGGYDEDIARIRETVAGSDAVTFTGFVEPSEIVYYQCAADVLVATADPDAQYFSPLKLFEYMAAGKPIVANRTPAFEEVLTEGENCLYVGSQNPAEMSSTVNTILSEPSLTSKMREANLNDVEQYTWEHRADTILEFIEHFN